MFESEILACEQAHVEAQARVAHLGLIIPIELNETEIAFVLKLQTSHEDK